MAMQFDFTTTKNYTVADAFEDQTRDEANASTYRIVCADCTKAYDGNRHGDCPRCAFHGRPDDRDRMPEPDYTAADTVPGYFDFGDGPLEAEYAPEYSLMCAERCSPSPDCYNDCMLSVDPEGHLANVRARQEAQHREEMYRVGLRNYAGMVTPFAGGDDDCPF